jgi:hypothetical protein
MSLKEVLGAIPEAQGWLGLMQVSDCRYNGRMHIQVSLLQHVPTLA